MRRPEYIETSRGGSGRSGRSGGSGGSGGSELCLTDVAAVHRHRGHGQIKREAWCSGPAFETCRHSLAEPREAERHQRAVAPARAGPIPRPADRTPSQWPSARRAAARCQLRRRDFAAHRRLRVLPHRLPQRKPGAAGSRRSAAPRDGCVRSTRRAPAAPSSSGRACPRGECAWPGFAPLHASGGRLRASVGMATCAHDVDRLGELIGSLVSRPGSAGRSEDHPLVRRGAVLAAQPGEGGSRS